MATAFATLLLSVSVSAWPQQQQQQVPRGAPVQGAPRLPVNAMAEAAQLVGVRRCLPAIARLSALSLQGSSAHDVVLDWDRQQPDASAFFGLMGVVQPPTGAHATTFTAVPDTNGGCTVLAERMAWAPQSCQNVAQSELQGYAAAQLVPGMWVLTNPSDVGSTISLLEAGPGCMVVRRFVQYRWREQAPDVPAGVTGQPMQRAPAPVAR